MFEQITIAAAVYDALIGVIIAIALEVVPGLAHVWAGFKFKPLLLFVGFLAVPALVAYLGCYENVTILELSYVCSPDGPVRTVVVALFRGALMFAASQLGYAHLSQRDIRSKARQQVS